MSPFDPSTEPSPAADLLRVHAPDTLRHRATRAALDWKASWLKLGAVLAEAREERAWVSYGFRSMKLWAEGELGIPSLLARRMLQGFEWIQDEAPDLARPIYSAEAPPVDRPVPDPSTVAILADARRKVEEDVVPAAVYDELRTRALRGESGAAEVRKELRAFLSPEPEPEANQDIPRLRKALRAAEKLLEQVQELGEAPAELVRMVSELRDHLFQTLAALEREGRDLEDADAGFAASSTPLGDSVVLPPPAADDERTADADAAFADDVEPMDEF